MEQEVEDMPEGPAKEYLLYEKKVMESAALAFLQPDEQITDFGNDFLSLPLMRHKAILWKEKMRLAVPRNEEGGYEGIPLTSEEAQTLIEDHPRWRKKWLSERPRDLTNFHNTPQYLQMDPTYCSMPRRRSWAKFQKWKGKNKALLNYPVLSAQEPPTVTYVVNTLNQTIQLLRDVPDLTCQMLVKIARMIVTCIQVFRDTEDDNHPWNLFFEGRRGICWNRRDSSPRWIIMAIYSRLMYLPSHFLQTFEEAFVMGFFKISTQIFHPMAKDLKARHITSRKDLFCSLDAAPAGKKVTCANNASYPIKGVGKILITISDGLDLCLPDVLYVPGIKKNLLSVSSLAKNGLRVIFEDDRCILRDRENGYSLITTGMLENELFVLDHYEKHIQACIAKTKTQAMQDVELWHARFGHVGYGSLMTLQRHDMVHDLSLLEMPPRHVCEGCVLGKMHRFAFSQDGSVRATRKLQLVHSDVCGPMRTPSVGNSLYFVTFIDDFSRFCWVYPLKAKSDVFAIFQHYVSMIENETGCKVQTLRTDQGGEYMSVACAAHVLNRCPTCALKTITPYESWYDRKPSVSYLRVFGCLAYAHIPQQLRGKLDDKAVKCIFVGYSSGSKGYRLYNFATNKIFESRDVIFAETTPQPMVAFDVPHMQTQDVFEGFLPSFVENQESQQVDNFDQHVTPHDVEEIVREEQEVLKEEQTLPKWVQKTLQDSKLNAPLPRKTHVDRVTNDDWTIDVYGIYGLAETTKALELTLRKVFSRMGHARPSALVIDKSQQELEALLNVVEEDPHC
ncbi:hypothetical protein L7F22_017512 [Adiantum nelumboides]|nr:hypothetical protein [Adiantum nelumboides]